MSCAEVADRLNLKGIEKLIKLELILSERWKCFKFLKKEKILERYKETLILKINEYSLSNEIFVIDLHSFDGVAYLENKFLNKT